LSFEFLTGVLFSEPILNCVETLHYLDNHFKNTANLIYAMPNAANMHCITKIIGTNVAGILNWARGSVLG
jgi:hypothetical protein